MFQLAAAIGYANHYRHRWASVPVNEEVPNYFDYFPNLPKCKAPLRSYQCHDPSTFNYKKIPDKGSVNLMGFFQSLKYFEHCQEEVKEVFKLPITEGMQDYCSIHVRRGDYVKYKTSFPPVTIDYINKAMSRMKYLGFPKFMVFSDDIAWCKNAIKVNVAYSEGKTPFEDMSLMASCGNHIISNSTFSWWAAYLGVNPFRHIISPSHKSWFGVRNGVVQAIGYPKDIIPNEWEQIDF